VVIRFLHEAAILLSSPGVRCGVQVTVRLLGPYKRAAGIIGDITLTVRAPNLGGVLAAIHERYPEAGRRLQPAPGTIEPAVRVLVNDILVQGPTQRLPLRDGDRVAFVPIVGGG